MHFHYKHGVFFIKIRKLIPVTFLFSYLVVPFYWSSPGDLLLKMLKEFFRFISH